MSLPTCFAHAYHSPRPNHLDSHHVIPLSWGGPDIASNRVTLCPTGHRNVHGLLDEYLKHAGAVPAWTVLGRWGPGERELAARAWRSALEHPDLYHPERTS